MPHDGHALALVVAGVAQHPAGLVEALHVGQEIFGDHFCPQRIARHQTGGRDLAFFSRVMGSHGITS